MAGLQTFGKAYQLARWCDVVRIQKPQPWVAMTRSLPCTIGRGPMCRQVLLERLPRVTVVERDVDAALGRRVQKSSDARILPDRVDRAER